MNKATLNRDIVRFSLYLFVFTIPLSSMAANHLSLLALLVSSFFYQINIRKNILISPILWLVTGLFFVKIVGFYTEGFYSPLFYNHLQRTMILLLVPIALFGISDLLSPKEINRVFNIFIYACLLICVHLIVTLFVNFDLFNSIENAEKRMGAIVRYSGSYLSYNVVVGIFLSVYLIKESKSTISLYWLYILFLIAILIFVSSKGPILAAIIPFIIIALGYFKFKTSQIITGFVTLLIMLSLMISSRNSLSKDLLNTFTGKWIYVEDGKGQNSISMRYYKWKCSVELIWDKPVLGYGPNQSQQKLNECYKENHFWGWRKSFNSHNQYLSDWLVFGIAGVLVLVSNLIIPLVISIKEKNWLLLAFILFMIQCLFVENILVRNKGVMLFAFILSILWITTNRYKLYYNERPVTGK